MTREEVDKLVKEINKKVKNNDKLSNFEDLVLEEIKLSKKENRVVSIRAVEDYKFWMD